MSSRMTTLVWPLQIDAPAKLVLMKLADTAGEDGAGASYPVVSLAGVCGKNRRTVQRYLRKFEADGILVPERNSTGGRGRQRVYRIDLESARACPTYGVRV